MSDLSSLSHVDPAIHDLIRREEERQDLSIRLIASENYASRAVMEATGTVLTNKYSEGYAGRRYYQGQEIIDQVERTAIERARALFGAGYANVQPYSGSPANQAVHVAFLDAGHRHEPTGEHCGDTIMGLALPAGGHLTHGWRVSVSGMHYRSVQYGLHPETHRIDMDQVRDLALRERPKLIWTGASAYPRRWDFEAFGEIAREVDAVLVADIAHFAGLVAGGAHPHPFPHADIVTTTTHKTLRGPRGGMILGRTEEHAKKIDRAVFPNLQGGPHNHTTAAIAVALKEAADDEFKTYAHGVVANARALADALLERGFPLVTGGTDNHLVLVDVRPRGVVGNSAAEALQKAGLETNSNAIPGDDKPMKPSGVRLGTAAVTSRGMKEEHMHRIAAWIDDAITCAKDDARLAAIREEIREFCGAFPCPGLR